MKKSEKAKDLLLKAMPKSMKLNGQEVVIITKVSYDLLLEALSVKKHKKNK